MKYPTLIVTLALLSSAGFAQTPLQINEIYASHASTDDQEMIELRGTPTTNLDGHMVLVVEGDGNPAGVLDRAWDLTGYSIPARGYFVLGDTGVTQKDYDIGKSNRIENGTNTIYLISTTDTSKITALVGKDVDSDKDLVTDIVGLAKIVDIIGMVDKGYPATDKVYDSAAAIGPDGSYGPAGVFRDESTATNVWCRGDPRQQVPGDARSHAEEFSPGPVPGPGSQRPGSAWTRRGGHHPRLQLRPAGCA